MLTDLHMSNIEANWLATRALRAIDTYKNKLRGIMCVATWDSYVMYIFLYDADGIANARKMEDRYRNPDLRVGVDYLHAEQWEGIRTNIGSRRIHIICEKICSN